MKSKPIGLREVFRSAEYEAKRTNFYRGEDTFHNPRLLHKRNVFMRESALHPKKHLLPLPLS